MQSELLVERFSQSYDIAGYTRIVGYSRHFFSGSFYCICEYILRPFFFCFLLKTNGVVS